ncbi:MAG: methyltransferase [Thermotogae bacterium]|nr:MAG: methyltransferase [Thermotogota bacterium]
MEPQKSQCDFNSDIFRGIRLKDAGKSHRPNHATSLLAWYVKLRKNTFSVVELGCGSGILSIYLAKAHGVKVTGIEKSALLAEIARLSVGENKMSDLVEIRNCSCGEVKSCFKAESFDAVVSNPPHHLFNVPSKDPVRRQTRTATLKTLDEFVFATSYLLKNRGEFYYVVSAEHLLSWIERLSERSLRVKNIRFAHGKFSSKAELALIRGVKNGGPGLIVEPPVFLRKD